MVKSFVCFFCLSCAYSAAWEPFQIDFVQCFATKIELNPLPFRKYLVLNTLTLIKMFILSHFGVLRIYYLKYNVFNAKHNEKDIPRGFLYNNP